MKMKALIVLPTGMADLPVPALEGRTPLQVAATPHLDAVARAGRLGTLRPVPEGLPITSDAALLSILGYDPRRESASRGGLEAAGVGVDLGPQDVAFRLNFASTFRDHLVDFQAGPIRGEEARVLIDALNDEVAWADVTFHTGLGYRNLMVVHGRPELDVTTVPPAVAQGLPIEQHLPTGADGGFLREIMQTAARMLGNHDVNRVRLDLGENAADQIWLWGEGRRVLIEPFELRTGLRLAVVAAVPLVRGLGISIGATVPGVPGATGDQQTDLGAKLACALELLETHDVVLLHVGAANEACHQTDIPAKVQALERIDRVLVGPAHQALLRRLDTRLLVTTDHMTSALVSGGCTTHVPFALWGPGVSSHRDVRYTEEDAARGDLVVDTGHTLLELTLKRTTG
jgi:2,3-bisphosphoglycerate-independent phosphoglycerate mutase